MKKIVYCIAIIMLLALTACSNTQQLHECPNCNENISENVKFCPNCGTNLSEIGKSNDSSDYDFAAIVDELDEASNTDAPPAIADEGTTQTDDEKMQKPIDWSELENTYQKITRQNMLDRVCPKDTFVLVEGVISNITEKTFDLWIPHNNSYWKDEGYKYDIELGDIDEGCTVEVYIATWSDGSLKKSDGITAIRKLDVEPIVDIVKTYKQTLPDFDYEKIMRNPDKAYGTVWKVMGDVIQVVETKSYLQEFLFETNDWDIIYVSYHKTKDEDNILEGDRLTLYGTFYMTKTYQTVLGSSNTVPILVADCYDMGFVYHEDTNEINEPPVNNNVGDIDLSEGVIVVSPTGNTVVSNNTENSTYSASIAVGLNYTVAVTNGGSVVAVGLDENGECSVESWENIVAVASGGSHTVGLKADGTVVAKGYNYSGQCNVSDWKDIVAISASTFSTLGLKSDGTVVIAGYEDDIHADIAYWNDIVAISDGGNCCVGLRKDGTVAVSGLNYFGLYDASNWKDMIDVKTSSKHTVGLKNDGTVVAIGDNEYGQCNTSDWTDIVGIAVDSSHTIGIKSDGTVVATGYNEYGQCNTSDWTNIIGVDVDLWHTVGLKSDGTVVAVGDNSCKQCDVSAWNDIRTK